MVKRPQIRRCSFGPCAGTGKAAPVLVLIRVAKPSHLIVSAGLGPAIHAPRRMPCRLLVGARPEAGQGDTNELELPPSHRGVGGVEAEVGGTADPYRHPKRFSLFPRKRAEREKPVST